MDIIAELRADLSECSQLVASCSRPSNRRALEQHTTLLTERLDKAIADQKRREDAKSAVSSDKKVYTVQIRTYGWDQSDKFVKLYVTIDSITAADKDKVSCSYTTRGLSLTVSGLKERNYQLVINNLAEDISPDGSSCKAKDGMVVVLLAKARQAQAWPAVTRQEAQAKEKAKAPEPASQDPNDSMMGLMKKMYDEGDDKMKQMLNKAWFEAQNKKSGLPDVGGLDMGGMGDL